MSSQEDVNKLTTIAELYTEELKHLLNNELIAMIEKIGIPKKFVPTDELKIIIEKCVNEKQPILEEAFEKREAVYRKYLDTVLDNFKLFNQRATNMEQQILEINKILSTSNSEKMKKVQYQKRLLLDYIDLLTKMELSNFVEEDETKDDDNNDKPKKPTTIDLSKFILSNYKHEQTNENKEDESETYELPSTSKPHRLPTLSFDESAAEAFKSMTNRKNEDNDTTNKHKRKYEDLKKNDKIYSELYN